MLRSVSGWSAETESRQAIDIDGELLPDAGRRKVLGEALGGTNVGTDDSSSGMVVRDESGCAAVSSGNADRAPAGSTKSERRIVGFDGSDGSDRWTAGNGRADGSSRTVLVRSAAA
jgi:hypothetical protein